MTPKEILTHYFGYAAFKPAQEKIINAILAKRNVVTVLPTGAGKSLCYQIPALLLPNFSIVVSPLIALMKDQVDALNRKKNSAAFINSSLNYTEIETILQKVRFGEIKLLYVAPERLEQISFAERMKELQPAALFVDEAHCISEWGHNFRPSYRKISDFVEFADITHISAFTATATPEVVRDIVKQLDLENPEIVVEGFARKNIALNVLQEKKKNGKTVELIKRFGTPAIIYAATRKNTEELSEFLTQWNIQNAFYHAGIPSERRKYIQEAFISDEIPVIVATNAFGMGIDKPDVRLVIHYNFPASIENYYQEFGRAGRDGKKSNAFLLYTERDRNIQQFFIQNSYPNKDFVLNVYNAVCDYGNVAVGNLADRDIPVDREYLSAMLKQKVTPAMISAALRILEDHNYLRAVSEFEKKSYLSFSMSPAQLKKYIKTMNNPVIQEILVVLLRIYGNVPFSSAAAISVQSIEEKSGIPKDEVDAALQALSASGIIEYDKPLSASSAKLLQPRIQKERLYLDFKRVNDGYLRAQKKLEYVIDYVFSRDCRSRFILRYFGEESDEVCGICDNCSSGLKESEDETEYIGELILRTILDFDDGLRESYLYSILRGVSKSAAFKQLQTFGLAKHYRRDDLKQFANNLIAMKYVKKDQRRHGRLFLAQKGREKLIQLGAIQPDEIGTDHDSDLELFHLLRDIRKKAAGRFGQTEQLICKEEMLRTLTAEKPAAKNELLAIPGFSVKMFNKIGEEFLTAIKDFIEKHPSEKKDETAQPVSDIPENLIPAYNLLLEGSSLSEISDRLKLQPPVISMQIETILQYKPNTSIDSLFDREKIKQISAVLQDGITDIKTIKRRLPDEISYPEIRIVLAKEVKSRKSNL